MKIYLVTEGPDIACPNDPSELIYGVFSSREAATECMKNHQRYMDSYGWHTRIRKDGKAYDKQGNIYFQILEWELDFCRKETWI